MIAQVEVLATPHINRNFCECEAPRKRHLRNIGINIGFAEAEFAKIAQFGGGQIQTEIVTRTSQLAHDEFIYRYIECHLIKCLHYTQAQVQYTRDLRMFMLTNPNATEFMTYKQQNPFPAIKRNRISFSEAGISQSSIMNSRRPR